jgi:hypothetical protein
MSDGVKLDDTVQCHDQVGHHFSQTRPPMMPRNIRASPAWRGEEHGFFRQSERSAESAHGDTRQVWCMR